MGNIPSRDAGPGCHVTIDRQEEEKFFSPTHKHKKVSFVFDVFVQKWMFIMPGK